MVYSEDNFNEVRILTLKNYNLYLDFYLDVDLDLDVHLDLDFDLELHIYL